MKMQRTAIMILCLTSLIVYGYFSVATGQEAGEELIVPTGSLALEAPTDVEARRAPVDFPHSLHFDYNCKVCHHTWEKTAEINGCMTSECHDLETAPKKADPDQMIKYYKKAYHVLCIGCHKDIKAQNKALAMSAKVSQGKLAKVGPTGCVLCHPKE